MVRIRRQKNHQHANDIVDMLVRRQRRALAKSNVMPEVYQRNQYDAPVTYRLHDNLLR